MNLRPLLPLALLLLSFSAAAQLPTREITVSVGRWDSNEVGNGPAIGASYNRYWTSLLSTRGGGFAARTGDFTTGAVHFSGELHLFRGARVSPWVGAGGAFAVVRRAASNDRFTGSESTLTGIYRGGVDVAVSPRFAVGAELTYMNYEVELGSRGGFTVDPVMVMVTGNWRF